EFALLLPECGSAEGLAIAKRIVLRVSGSQIEPGVTVSVSAGVATHPGPGVERTDLVRLADRTLYAAKAEGKNTVRLYQPGVDERQVVRTHPHVGYRMLSSLGIEPVATWVLHHHERWDGRGYPNGLAGEEIPTGSRILFVADAYEAMTADRVYRGRMSHAQAL